VTIRARPSNREGLPQDLLVPVATFACLAMALAWSAGWLLVHSDSAGLVSNRPSPADALHLPPVAAFGLLFVIDFGPAIAAVAAVVLFRTRVSWGPFFLQFQRWRVAWRWWAVALAMPGLLSMLPVPLFVLGGGRLPEHWFTIQWGSIALTAIGGWGEELGWRGYAQARLQSRFQALPVAVAVGLIWQTWHVWPDLLPGGAGLDFNLTLSGVIYRVAAAIFLAWLYNSSRGSLPLAVAGHVGLNAVHLQGIPEALFAATFAVAAAALVVFASPRSLARGFSTPPTGSCF
jgi:uncharacterized protein